MTYRMDLSAAAPKRIYSLGPEFSGVGPGGEKLSFTNYYMEMDGAPYFGVSGEIHFSRLWEGRWEDALLKMKAGGVNIVSTYVFWIHHEETEGRFDFEGRRNLRRFVELCAKCGLEVIARIGPFCHGESRNGGLPDWLYGKPYEVRGLDEGFLEAVRRWYRAVARELQGLYFKDGGPIIAVQLDNEYMHSAAPWEMTAGLSNEWLPAGADGDRYLMKLHEIALAEGIDAPFYTATGWGGAATPEKMMPLWGGYAYRPWIFYSHKGEHPATEEYIYRDNHNDVTPATYNFEPRYSPESRPYLCCEMGGGMFSSYNYRFRLPFESVDAMANIKLGSGCNMLGYYMYHGGTNPTGRGGAFLNEGQVPRLSYDFQAALGEFGQPRPSYGRLRALHLLTRAFEGQLCRMKTFLPDGSQQIPPENAATLRFAVRMSAEGAGFLFINNFQDHAEMAEKRDETVILNLPGGEAAFRGLSLAAGENCVLPFNLSVGGVALRLAHAQPLHLIEADGVLNAFFFAPEGMAPRYVFPAGTEIEIETGSVQTGENVTVEGELPRFTATEGGARVRFITLSRQDSLRFCPVEVDGRAIVLLTDGAVLPGSDGLRLQSEENSLRLGVFPAGAFAPEGAALEGSDGVFESFRLECAPHEVKPRVQKVGPTRYAVEIPEWEAPGVKDALIRIRYHGDIGQAFIDGEMVSDNFSNGAVWDIGLSELRERLGRSRLTVLVTPVRAGVVQAETTMAGRREELCRSAGALDEATVVPIYEWRLTR